MSDGADLGFDFRAFAVSKRSGGRAIEVLADVIVVILAHHGDDFVAKLDAIGIELALEVFTTFC